MLERLRRCYPLLRLEFKELLYQINRLLRCVITEDLLNALHRLRCDIGGGAILWIYVLHLGGCGATLGIDDQRKLVDVAIALEQREARGGYRPRRLTAAVLVVAYRKELR